MGLPGLMNACHVGAIGPLTVIVRRQPMFGIDTLLLQSGDGHAVWNGIPFFHIARKREEDRVGQEAGRIRVETVETVLLHLCAVF